MFPSVLMCPSVHSLNLTQSVTYLLTDMPRTRDAIASKNKSQGPTVLWSQALKPFYSSQNPLNSSLSLKQLLLVSFKIVLLEPRNTHKICSHWIICRSNSYMAYDSGRRGNVLSSFYKYTSLLHTKHIHLINLLNFIDFQILNKIIQIFRILYLFSKGKSHL